MFALSDIPNAVAHASLQLTAIPIGVVLDSLFTSALSRAETIINDDLTPMPGSAGEAQIQDYSDLVVKSLEVGLQIVTTAVIVGVALTTLSSIPYDSGDPAGGFTFGILLYNSQTNMNRKLRLITAFVRDRWRAQESAWYRRSAPQAPSAHTVIGNTSCASKTQIARRAGFSAKMI